jgi:nucleotide-binding universal stress UspA family protein
MIKDVLVPITNTAGDANALAAAIALAAHEDAHLNVLECVNLPLPPYGPWGNGDLELGEIYAKCRVEAEADAVAWRERLAREAPSSEVRVIESVFTESAGLAAQHARCSDIIVMTMATGVLGDAMIIRDFFTTLLLESGRPVLLVPPDYAWRPAKHAVIAWRPTREATRALHDAMPLLRAAEWVDVLEVDIANDEACDSPPPGGDPTTHLRRHGLKARAVSCRSHGGSVASALIKHTQDSGADLLIAGGYGHSRFREWVLGGATRELLSGACSVPILLSH